MIAALVFGWAAVLVTVESAHFVVVAPAAQIGVDAAGSLARLFGALVLFLFPDEVDKQRLRWVAGGFVTLALGSLFFGYLPAIINVDLALNTTMYAWLVVRGVANILFVMGLLPAVVPRLTPWRALGMFICLGLLSLIIVTNPGWLPRLTELDSVAPAVAHSAIPLPGLTSWYWGLSGLLLALALLAMIGAAWQQRHERLGGWLLIAMVLLAGSQLHALLWPSAYSDIVTTADLLRLAFAATVAVGGVVELRRVAAKRAMLLAAERDYSRRLTELAVLKADFTAMVAHELSSPLAAIRGLADMVGTRELAPAQQASAVATIRAEVERLTALVADVQMAAIVERDDFAVRLRPVRVGALLDEAALYAAALPGDHPMMTSGAIEQWVWADPERLGQVLHNLLDNAAKYSPDGLPIELRARECANGRIRLEVSDHGIGIGPEELTLIFEKFKRGRNVAGRRAPGLGLGLYLSRRIVRAHGTDLTAESEPGIGSTFAFELERAA